MLHTIDALLSKIIKNGKTNYDLDKITQAYLLAEEAHMGQKRSSGDPYITHPIAVANILLEYNMDTDTIVAAILHDTVEDTGITLSVLEKRFGEDVALLVDGVTKMAQVPLNHTKEEVHAENIRKILVHMAKDVRVILIKLADRLHNMRTLDFRPQTKQLDTSFETMSFYAPIAHRVGVNKIKEEMEDISLRFLDPYAFNTVAEQIRLHKEQREAFINRITDTILERIGNIKPDPVIEGRVKSIYSIYKKVYVDGKNFEEIYDIYAVRIIVQSVIECYNILGIIHDLFHPIPFRFKDYIATPKNNRYQSLHTTVLCKEGIAFEVQIRTHEMHNTAEYGVAAHWKYKAGIKGKTKSDSATKLEWIRHILEQQQEAGDDVQQITEAIKTDLVPYEVYAFTPQGDVITLPLGANVIDFAYMIHSEVGNKMTGAKVGGRIVNFEHALETGDIVEILTTNSPAYGPNRNWLEMVKTNQAKVKIRSWFRRERRSENISQGKDALDRELKRNSLHYDDELLKEAAAELRFNSTDDFLAAIGYGGVTLAKSVQKIKDIYTIKHGGDKNAEPVDFSALIAKKQSKGVIVEGIDNCLVRFAQCCTPVPGDEIIGFITRGYGVSVHKKECSNVKTDQNLERWINVWWERHGSIYYRAGIEIIAEDRTSLLADVTSVISANKLNISDFVSKKLKNGNACIEASMEIANIDQLHSLLAKLKKIPGVIMATRRDN